MLTAASATLAFTLGVRHALDADHLAAIDGVTRWNVGQRNKLAPYCGGLFSAGHSAIIVIAALVLSIFADQWRPPEWLTPVGVVISALTLLALSAANLRAMYLGRQNLEVAQWGPRARLFAPLLRAPSSSRVMLLGALFALSFDALALATLFAMSVEASERTTGGVVLALTFALGMIAVGAANGMWVTRLLKHSRVTSRHAMRVMTLAIAIAGAGVGACALLALTVESVDRWLSDNELVMSGLVVTLVVVGYCGALLQGRRAQNLTVTNARIVRGSTG
ncbi:MAG: hypothetical protein WDO68_03520 [Gammaproteobacteria bacterium]